MKQQLFEIKHVTTYRYEGAVALSHHLLRLTPRELNRQRCLSHFIELDPTPTVTATHTDYFGNRVTFITQESVHSEFTVIAQSTVAVGPASIPDPAETPPWETVRRLCNGDHTGRSLEATEFVYNSPLVQVHRGYADYAAASFTPNRPMLEAALDLTRRIHADFKFDAKATTVATPLQQVFQQRRGVCQDFAHIQIACFRAMGIPARYVSGYLETLPPVNQPRLIGADASHAWVAFFCPGLGWTDLDPTNNVLPSLRHITLGWGRDFSDVSPIRGVILGGGHHTLKVGVDVIPLDTISWSSG
ncbi:MAG: transglutaminase family protein [Verrucomicrobiota bacterium]